MRLPHRATVFSSWLCSLWLSCSVLAALWLPSLLHAGGEGPLCTFFSDPYALPPAAAYMILLFL